VAGIASRIFLDLRLDPGTYWVQVDGYAGDQGDFDLDVRRVGQGSRLRLGSRWSRVGRGPVSGASEASIPPTLDKRLAIRGRWTQVDVVASNRAGARLRLGLRLRPGVRAGGAGR
jgi:hypothetical protein